MIDIPYSERALGLKLTSVGRKKVILLFGARQTGKTTLLREATRASRCFPLNLQDRQQRRRYETDPGLLRRELQARPDIDTVFVDEIQKVPVLLDDVQLLYDEDPQRYRFLLTGSSDRQLRRGSANLLPGRSHQYIL
jgi:predicted AAA+ superfamily ATPase